MVAQRVEYWAKKLVDTKVVSTAETMAVVMVALMDVVMVV